MTFEEWWDKPVQGSDFSKDQMSKDVKMSVYQELGRDFDLKIAMKDAWENARDSI